jgi:hypothetical protein
LSKLAQLANNFCRQHGLSDRFVARGSCLHWIAEEASWSVRVDPQRFEHMLTNEQPEDADDAALLLCFALGGA